MPEFWCGNNNQPDLQPPKLFEQCYAPAHTAREPVKAVDDDLAYLSIADEGQETIESGSFEGFAGVSVIIETVRGQLPPLPTLGLGIEATCIVLDLARRKIIG